MDRMTASGVAQVRRDVPSIDQAEFAARHRPASALYSRRSPSFSATPLTTALDGPLLLYLSSAILTQTGPQVSERLGQGGQDLVAASHAKSERPRQRDTERPILKPGKSQQQSAARRQGGVFRLLNGSVIHCPDSPLAGNTGCMLACTH
jgi:hypothetical protein